MSKVAAPTSILSFSIKFVWAKAFPSLIMIPSLNNAGSKIRYYDPTGEKKEFAMLKNVRFFNNIYEACHDADLIIIHTDWDEFKSIDFKKIIKRKNTKVYDLRNLYFVLLPLFLERQCR